MRSIYRLTNIILLITSFLYTGLAVAANFSQIVVPFTQAKVFSHHLNQDSNTLTLKIKNTTTEELEPIYNYDPTLVNRLLIRESAGSTVSIDFVLAHNRIRTAVYSFQEPYRIVIDLFVDGYEESNDPLTGLPNSEDKVSSDKPSTASNTMYNYKLSKQAGNELSRVNKNDVHDEFKKLAVSTYAPENKRRLLQPSSNTFSTKSDLLNSIDKIPSGIGGQWQRYPIYMHRLATHTLKTGKNYQDWIEKNSDRVLSSAESLADYASQMFEFGHELKALMIYQKVLYQSPLVFDRDAKHIWNLGEVHFGQGNLVLAKGYYESLVDKHPDSPLAQYAKIRILDCSYIAETDKGSYGKIRELYDRLALISSASDKEIGAQVAIRKSYWSQPGRYHKNIKPNQDTIPALGARDYAAVSHSIGTSQNPRSNFILYSLKTNYDLTNQSWNEDLAADTKTYLTRFKSKEANNYRQIVLQNARTSIQKKLASLRDQSEYPAVIRTIENLPKELNIVDASYELTKLAAESYRKQGNTKESLAYYEKVLRLVPDANAQFETLISLIDVGTEALSVAESENKHALIKRIRRQKNKNNKNLNTVWQEIDDARKFELASKHYESLANSVFKRSLNSTYADIFLWSLKKSLDPNSASSTSAAFKSKFIENERSVQAIKNLALVFERIGDKRKSQEATNLLRFVDPNAFSRPQDRKLWAEELAALAEDYRLQNKYLDAGRIYALTGEKSTDWENRAEALYKGGLLLYRSGRREEALSAFEQAASDSNNLLYAELARKRLEQLKE